MLRSLVVFSIASLLCIACGSASDDPESSGGGGASNAGASNAGAGSGGKSSAGSAGQGGSSAGAGSAGAPVTGGGAAGAAGAPSGKPALGVNDVSYVFPLPQTEAELAQLLPLSAAGAGGPLLSKAVGEAIVQPVFPRQQNVYAALRVLVMRLDPCAAVTTIADPASCVSEIRLVAHVLSSPGSAGDSGIHLTYRVTRAELDRALAELLALKQNNAVAVSDQPLGRHPIMVKEGLSGPFARGVNAVISKFVGMDKLFRLTEFSVGPEGNDWLFTQFEKNAAGQFVRARIAKQDISAPDAVGSQMTVEESRSAAQRKTSIHEADPGVGFPSNLLDSESALKLDDKTLTASLNRLAAIEDPARISTNAVDCGSCHVAGNARAFYEQYSKSRATMSFVAPAGQNLQRVSEVGLDASALHMLSYFGGELQVSQRAINESARVADWLSNGF